MPNNSNYSLEDIKDAIIDLYQNVKIRKQSETISIDESYLNKEKLSLENVSPLTLISYIKPNITQINIIQTLTINFYFNEM